MVSLSINKSSRLLAILILMASLHYSYGQYCNTANASMAWTDDTVIWCNCGMVSCTNKGQCLMGMDPETSSQGFEVSTTTCLAYSGIIQTNYAMSPSNSLGKCPGEECASCSMPPGSFDASCATCPIGATSSSIFTLSKFQMEKILNFI